MSKRDFLRSSMGMASAFMASNMVYDPYWDVEAAETLEPDASKEKWPKGEYFIFDVQVTSRTDILLVLGVPSSSVTWGLNWRTILRPMVFQIS